MHIWDYSVRANLGRVPDDKSILLNLTNRELSRVEIFLNWAKENDKAGLATKDLLSATNIDKFLVTPRQAHVRGRKLKPISPPRPPVKRCTPNPGEK